jgi:hypothetical protein
MERPALYSMELVELFMKYRESYTGKLMSSMLKKLDTIAKILVKRHDINCCSKQDTKHLKFQCGFSEEVLIILYLLIGGTV